MDHSALDLGLVLLVAAVAAVTLLRRWHLPPVLGYLLVGLIAGPNAFGWFPDNAATGLLGEIGIAFLLFTIGLEFSMSQFWAMRKTLVGLGGAQVLVSTLSAAALAWISGMPIAAALVVGGALAMSSTAIVIKQLTDQMELTNAHGRLALGILLFQDLAAVPFLVIIPILADGSANLFMALLWSLLKATLAFAVLLAIGRFWLRPLFHEVARAQSAELFTLSVLLVAVAAAWITAWLGLSLALGAFLAGMMLAETEYRHPIEADIRPFRDVLLGLFFISVGMKLDPFALMSNFFWVVLLLIGLVVGKGACIFGLTRLAGYSVSDALRTGIVLAQGGEFGFALLALALSWGLLESQALQPVLAAVVLSMLMAPLLVRYNHRLAQRFFPEQATPGVELQAQDIVWTVGNTVGHVVLCGYGRVGKALAGVLRQQGLSFVALDMAPEQVRQAWETGEPVCYGDSTHPDILNAAGLDRAQMLIITYDDIRSTFKILHNVRAVRPDLPVLVRTRDSTHFEQLIQAGATEVVPETLEASLTLSTQMLLLLGHDPQEVLKRIARIRRERYRILEPLYRVREQVLRSPTE